MKIVTEIEEAQIPKEMLDMALDSILNGPMTTRYGSMASREVMSRHGEIAWLAARELVKPLADKLKIINKQKENLVAEWKKGTSYTERSSGSTIKRDTDLYPESMERKTSSSTTQPSNRKATRSSQKASE